MTLAELRATLGNPAPPDGLAPPVRALWLEASGDWDAAHRTVQAESDASAAWVHAYLHRREGDPSNAAYWYRRAGRPVCEEPLEREWEAIVGALLAGD